MEQYDYIICGAGCAGLSLAYRLADSSFSHLKILLLDKQEKNSNDRTWCFWTKDQHLFDSVVYKHWNRINFYGEKPLERLEIAPYRYQMIRGIDFYEYTLAKLNKCAHIDIKYEAVESIKESEYAAIVTTERSKYQSSFVFSSIVNQFPEKDDLFVWQHFKGWIVETAEPCFDKDVATFMDFRIDQGGETRFVYVLPHADNKALVEATVFSKDIWSSERYDKVLEKYCTDYLKLSEFKILEEERGAIPMTTATFTADRSKRMIPIGTLNGTVKPSSGYTFTRIQEECDQLMEQIRANTNKVVAHRQKPRFLAYDKTLLHVLLTNKESGKRVFSMMFEKNRVPNIFKFLDERSSLLTEASIFKTLPIWSFTKAFLWENVFKRTKR